MKRDFGLGINQTDGFALRSYLVASTLLAPLARPILAWRRKKGKEHADRWVEKLGQASAPRPTGRLIWMHAVGVGEALALNGLIAQMSAENPKFSFLVTTSSATAAQALKRNLPARTIHQFLPLDFKPGITQFLDHWKPDLSIWAERDIWPALITQTKRRGIPMAIVNGRMDAASFRKKAKARSLYANLYQKFDLVDAQDGKTKDYFAQFGVELSVLKSSGTLKAAGVPLADAPNERAAWIELIGENGIWVATSTHAADEAVVLDAHARILCDGPDAVLVIAPRVPTRADDIVAAARAAGISAAKLGSTPPTKLTKSVYVDTRIGYLGLWYRLSDVALVGGSIADVGGHNPYEPARLNCAILHGPNVYNFASDYAMLSAAGGSKQINDAKSLTAAVTADDHGDLARAAAELAQHKQQAVADMATTLIALMREKSPNA